MTSKTGTAKVPVALPKTNESSTGPAAASTSLISQDSALYSAIGGKIRITTASNSAVEGILYTADPLTSFLILQISASSSNTITPTSLTAPAGSYRIIPFSQITAFTILSQGPATAQDSTPAPPIDTAATTNRLNTALATAQAAISRQGPKGTSPRGQALFDALSRTHPARWEGTNMIVSDSFRIEKPYSSATTTNYSSGGGGGSGGNAQTNGSTFKGDLARFKNIVDMELKKAEFRMGKAALDARVTIGGGDEEGKGG